jgi:hypothetical protein
MASSSELLPNGVGRVPAWWMECTPHYTLDVDDEEARQIAEDQVAFFFMMLAAADDAGYIGPDGKPKIGPDGKPMVWQGLGSSWNNGSGQYNGRNFKPGQAVIDPSLFGIKESDPNYNAYLTGAKLPPGYFEKMAELVDEQNNAAGNPYGILNNSKQTDFGRYGRQAERQLFQPSWAKKKLRTTTQGQAVRSGQYNDSPNKFLDINGRQRRVTAKDEGTGARPITPDPEPVVTSASSAPTPMKSVGNAVPSAQPVSVQPSGYVQPVASVQQSAASGRSSTQAVTSTGEQRITSVGAKPPVKNGAPGPSTSSPSAPVTVSRKVRQVRMVSAALDSMITNKAHLQKQRDAAAAAERQQQEELERQKANEVRKKQLEKMQQLQMQAAAEEAEAERKRQEAAALALKQQKEAELQQLRMQQAQQQQQQTQRQEQAIDPSIAEKLRRLEELKELKRQQELAEAQSAAGTAEEYDEETFVEEEEELVEEEVTVGEEDEEYTLEEETYVEDTSITQLQAILAAKQAELAKLQGTG